MQEYRAKLSHLRVSPRKTRLVVDLIRGLDATEARYQLNASSKRPAVAVLKLLNSAVNNAKQVNEETKEEDLFIKEAFVDEGPKLKRYRPVSRGAVHEIQKKTSHVTLILAEKENQEPKEEVKSKSPKEKIKTKAKKQ